MKTTKRILAILLSASLTLLPIQAPAIAADDGGSPAVTDPAPQETDPADDPVPMTDPRSTEAYAPILDCDDTDVRVGETFRIHVTHPVTGKVSDARLFPPNDLTDAVEWEFDAKSSDLVVTAHRPFFGETFVVTAAGCAFTSIIDLTAHYPQTHEDPIFTYQTETTSQPSTTASTSYQSTAATVTSTSAGTDPIPTEDYAPKISCDTNYARIGGIFRIHVEHPKNGFVSYAAIDCPDDSGLIEYEFDPATSDLVVTAHRPFYDKNFIISAEGCSLNAFIHLSAGYPQTHEDPIFTYPTETTSKPSTTASTAQQTDLTKVSTSTTRTTITTTKPVTTTTETTATTEYRFTPHPFLIVECTASTLRVGQTCRINAYVVEWGLMEDLSYEVEDESLASLTPTKYDNEYTLLALKPGTYRITFHFQDQAVTKEVKIVPEETSTTAVTKVTKASATTTTTTKPVTTTTETTATTEYRFTPHPFLIVDSTASTLRVGQTCRINAYVVEWGLMEDLSYEVEDESLASLTPTKYDNEYTLLALKPGTYRITFHFQDQAVTKEIKIVPEETSTTAVTKVTKASATTTTKATKATATTSSSTETTFVTDTTTETYHVMPEPFLEVYVSDLKGYPIKGDIHVGDEFLIHAITLDAPTLDWIDYTIVADSQGKAAISYADNYAYKVRALEPGIFSITFHLHDERKQTKTCTLSFVPAETESTTTVTSTTTTTTTTTTKPATSPTETTTTTEYHFTPHPVLIVDCNASTLRVGKTCRIIAGVMEWGLKEDLSYTIEDPTLASLIPTKYDNEYTLLALKPGTYRITFYFQDQTATAEVKIVPSETDPIATETTTTTTAATTTTTAEATTSTTIPTTTTSEAATTTTQPTTTTTETTTATTKPTTTTSETTTTTTKPTTTTTETTTTTTQPTTTTSETTTTTTQPTTTTSETTTTTTQPTTTTSETTTTTTQPTTTTTETTTTTTQPTTTTSETTTTTTQPTTTTTKTTTATTETTTTTTETQPTVTTGIETSYDDSPMQPGEVRAVRFWDKAAPDKILQNISSKRQSEDFRTHYDADTNTIYVTALTAGKVKLAIFCGPDATPVTVSIPIGEASDKHVQKLGYITDDELVNAGDAADILREASRIGANAAHLLDGLKSAAADVNFDDLVNAKDANAILVYAAYKGTHPDAPDFPGYIAMQYAQADPSDFRQYTYFGSLYAKLSDDSSWTEVNAASYPKYKYSVISSDEAFAALAAHMKDNTALQNEVTYCKEHKFFDTQALIAIVTEEPVSGYSYQLANVTNYAELNKWTVDLICTEPVQGGPMMYSKLILISADKSAASADEISIKMTHTSYDPAFAVPFTAYTNLNMLSVRPEKPVIITSQAQLSEVFGDELNKSVWLKMGDVKGGKTHTAAEAGDEDFFDSQSLILMSQLEMQSGFFDLHISDVAFNETTGELTVTGVRIPAANDVMGYEYWRILLGISKETAAQIKTVTFRYGEPIANTAETPSDPSVLRSAWAVKQATSFLPTFQKLYTSIEALKADYPQGLNDQAGNAYDSDFFKDHALVVIGRALPSGSIKTTITNVTEQDGVYTVTIQDKVPSVCTDDMAYWQLFAEVSKSDAETCSLEMNIQTLYADEQ